MKDLLIASVSFLILMLMFSMPVNGMERFLQQRHNIEIEVECLDTALSIIAELNGHNIESHVQASVGLSPHERYRERRTAFIRRNVDEWAFRHVQIALRSLGDVLIEFEEAIDLRWAIMDAEVRIRALTTEIERLTRMMALSTTLNNMITINDRLNTVSQERDRQIGRRNLLLSQAQNPVVMISLTEFSEVVPTLAAPAFGSRVADSFLTSWNGFLRGLENFAVVVARTALPFVIWSIVLFVVVMVSRIFYVKRLKHRIGSIVENGGWYDD